LEEELKANKTLSNERWYVIRNQEGIKEKVRDPDLLLNLEHVKSLGNVKCMIGF